MVKKGTQKSEHLHCIGFWIAVLHHWMNGGKTTMGFAVKVH